MQISEFQGLIEKTFFERDKKRGVARNYLRFVEEVGELAESIFYDNRENLPLELADVFAWLASIASQCGVSLEDAIGKYFSDPKVGYLHIHNAGPGCYNCTVRRA